MKSKDHILSLSPDEMQSKLAELQAEMENLQLQQATHQITNPLRIRIVRRDIARVHTLLNEYQIGIRIANVEKK